VTLGIERIAGHLPARFITAAELEGQFGFDAGFIPEKLGVGRVFAARDDEHSSDLAVAAIAKLCDGLPGLRDRIDTLVVCTQTPDYQLPQVSALVQDRAGLRQDVAAFDISLGCSGFVYGLSILEGFMTRNGLAAGVLVTAETYSKITGPGDRTTRCLFSDAAAATLVTAGGALQAGRYTFGTNGSKFDSLICRSGGSGDDGERRPRLSMDGRSIYEFAMETVPQDVARCLAANGIGLQDVDLFVFHQASGFLVDAIARRLGLAGDPRIVKTLGDHGNAVSSSIPLALARYLGPDSSQYRRILISGFGVGLSWASTVLTRKDAR